MINVLNGTLHLGIGEIQEIQSQLEAGLVRLLATLAERRLPRFPDLATAKEQGVDLTATKFRGLAGPKGIPDEIAAQWEAALRQVLDSPAYREEEECAKDSLAPALMGREEARRLTAEFAREVTASLRELGVIR